MESPPELYWGWGVNPTPGSPEAVEAGCTCPVIDNHYGRGIEQDGGEYDEPATLFWYSEGCPVHDLHRGED